MLMPHLTHCYSLKVLKLQESHCPVPLGIHGWGCVPHSSPSHTSLKRVSGILFNLFWSLCRKARWVTEALGCHSEGWKRKIWATEVEMKSGKQRPLWSPVSEGFGGKARGEVLELVGQEDICLSTVHPCIHPSTQPARTKWPPWARPYVRHWGWRGNRTACAQGGCWSWERGEASNWGSFFWFINFWK